MCRFHVPYLVVPCHFWVQVNQVNVTRTLTHHCFSTRILLVFIGCAEMSDCKVWPVSNAEKEQKFRQCSVFYIYIYKSTSCTIYNITNEMNGILGNKAN